MLISGLAELFSLGAVLPFLAVLAEPELLTANRYIKYLYNYYDPANSSAFPQIAIILFVSTVFITAIVRLFSLRLNIYWAARAGSDLGTLSFSGILAQPYTYHFKENSSSAIINVTSQVNLTVQSFIAFLQLITSTTITVCIVFGLILVNSTVALTLAIVFGSAYLIIASSAKKRLSLNGIRISELTISQLKLLQESLGSIREILLGGNQDYCRKSFENFDRPLRVTQASNNFISSYPRFILESLGMIALSLLGYSFLINGSNSFSPIAILGVFALGSQRILPSLQQIYSSWAAIRSYNYAMLAVLKVLDSQKNLENPIYEKIIKQTAFNEKIKFQDVSFSYSENGRNVINKLNLEIKKGERLGIIGSTGSGKTTILDILMGLIKPSSGKIYVDGIDLYGSNNSAFIYSWRSSISHIPQSIFLKDGSIAENIAFPAETNLIDMKMVEKSAACAQISGFIELTEEGYFTRVGERGARLSGGQIQRIGIARAVYKQSDLLIFDEATSALDTQTEKLVMSSIESLLSESTIIIVAHRLSTLRYCDRIIEINEGLIVKEYKDETEIKTLTSS